MSQSLLQRAIDCLKTGKTPPEPVREYMLSILDKRHRKPGKSKAAFKSLLQPIPRLKKELDRVFSIFIRTRDCNQPGGFGNCATCGCSIHAAQTAQASHYQVRQDFNTRWDEKNVHAACGNCNGFRGGEPEKMAEYIDRKYGAGTSEILRAKARLPLKLNRHLLQMWITHYEKLNAEGSRGKGCGMITPTGAEQMEPTTKQEAAHE